MKKIFNKDYPLGLPQGSVRAILALSMVIFVFVWFIEFKNIPKELVGMISFVLTWYFVKRDGYVNKTNHYKLRYRINEQSKLQETIISEITPGEAINKLRSNLSETEYLNLMVDEIIRID